MSGIKLALQGEEKLLRRLTEVSRIVEQSTEAEMREMAIEIKEGSERRAPFKTGDLEDSHKLIETKGGDGRSSYKIAVGPVYGDDGEEYSLRMHEGIDGEKYGLGPGSKDKNTSTPHRGEGVGWKFLQRSFDKVYRMALRRVKKKVKAGMNAGMRAK